MKKFNTLYSWKVKCWSICFCFAHFSLHHHQVAPVVQVQVAQVGLVVLQAVAQQDLTMEINTEAAAADNNTGVAAAEEVAVVVVNSMDNRG